MTTSSETSQTDLFEKLKSLPKFDQFKIFHSLFNKTYDINSEEGQRRYQIFKKSLQEISEHNSVNGQSYKLGVTEFADMEESEFQTNQIFFDDTFNYEDTPIMGSSFMTSVDWRSIFSEKQAALSRNCNSESYLAVGSAVEAAYNIKYRTRVSLSAQSLVDCKGCDQFADFVNDYGMINEFALYEDSAYPWTGEYGVCHNYLEGKKYKPIEWEVSYFGRNSISPQMAVNTLKKGPFLFRQAFTFPRQFTGGIYTPTQGSNRCGTFYFTSLVVGYGVESATNRDYWVIKAPYGETWGEQGFIRVKRNDSLFNYGITCAYSQPRFE